MGARVVVVGSINVDAILRVESHPKPGETVLARNLDLLPGGKGANLALAAAAGGAEVLLVGRVGDDEHGRRYVAELASRGVDTSAVTVDATHPTGQAFITVDAAGENSIIVVVGSNGAIDPDAAARSIPDDAALVVTQLELAPEVAEAVLRRAREVGAVTVLNPSPVSAAASALLELADVVVVNEHEWTALGEPADACVTLGAAGARWGVADAAPDPVDVVDTTGAGDAFAGALVAALARGAAREDALQAAVAAGAKATTYAGAQPWGFSAPVVE
ncbi:PfkB family carbohydrate kinase [Agromyces salentinus]|uniref:Ribokinase n=1 Tax=Agromyces salentinus TaxID=269421 RepID=A0ABN2MHS5_9MICO|nr:PfkB family carbohydrate kinase [Agromyces salentinus]